MPLKQSYARNSRRSRLHTGLRVSNRDSSQRQHPNVRPASLAQFPQPGRGRGCRASFLEDWRKHCEVRALRRCPRDFCGRVAGHADKPVPRRRFGVSDMRGEDLASLVGENIVRAKVHPIGADSNGHVRTGIDEKSGSRFKAPSSLLFTNGAHSFACQGFQFPRQKVLFPQLDIVHAAARRFRDPVQQEPPAVQFVSWKLSAIRNVVQEQGLASFILRQRG